MMLIHKSLTSLRKSNWQIFHWHGLLSPKMEEISSRASFPTWTKKGNYPWGSWHTSSSGLTNWMIEKNSHGWLQSQWDRWTRNPTSQKARYLSNLRAHYLMVKALSKAYWAFTPASFLFFVIIFVIHIIPITSFQLCTLPSTQFTAQEATTMESLQTIVFPELCLFDIGMSRPTKRK